MNYWLLDPFRRTLDCLRLADGQYNADVSGKDQEIIAPAMFPGLQIQLGNLWI
jgi:Uma2 family endonuclease